MVPERVEGLVKGVCVLWGSRGENWGVSGNANAKKPHVTKGNMGIGIKDKHHLFHNIASGTHCRNIRQQRK